MDLSARRQAPHQDSRLYAVALSCRGSRRQGDRSGLYWVRSLSWAHSWDVDQLPRAPCWMLRRGPKPTGYGDRSFANGGLNCLSVIRDEVVLAKGCEIRSPRDAAEGERAKWGIAFVSPLLRPKSPPSRQKGIMTSGPEADFR